MAEPCKHEKRGTIDFSSTHWTSAIARNSNDNHLGAVQLEFCDKCGAVLVAKRHVGLLPLTPKRNTN